MPVDLSEKTEKKATPTQKVTEKFNTDIKEVKTKNSNSTYINVGNSGLIIKLLNDEYNHHKATFDYYPNIDENNQNDFRAIKANMFTSALLSFRDWLANPEVQKKHNFNKNSISKLADYTNEKMANFIEKIFVENGHPEMVSKDDKGRGIYIEMDIMKLTELKETDKLIQYLKKAAGRTKDLTITYNKKVEYF